MAEQMDLIQALEKRDEGIEQVARNNERFLDVARQIARSQARIHGSVTTDDVRQLCPLDPLHPNAWGAVFRHKDFVTDGQTRRSKLVQGHGNRQLIWRLAK